MAVKPIYAVGLDTGSRRTRMAICTLEGGRLRFLGAASVESEGWQKGRIADQRAVTDCILRVLREAEANAGVSVEAVVAGRGRPHGARRERARRGGVGPCAGDRTARREPRGGPRLQRAIAGRPHGAAIVPAGFRG